MKFQKAIHRAEMFFNQYQKEPSVTRLNSFKRLHADLKSRSYLFNIKYLYTYQLLKGADVLPEWYMSLANTRFTELEKFFNSEFHKLLVEDNGQLEELNKFLIQRIAWIYQGKFRVYPTTPLDYLPLKLRLSVYIFLYQNEEDQKARCHLRSRIATSLARLGYLELANFYSVYNWLMAQDVTNTHFRESRHLIRSLQSQKYMSQSAKRLAKDGEDVSKVTELNYYYTQLLNPKNMKYDRAHVATIDLVIFYYEEYPQLKELGLPLKNYLRTHNKEEFYEAVAKQRMKFIRDAVKVPYTLREMIMTPIDQEQLIIYNYLLRIIV